MTSMIKKSDIAIAIVSVIFLLYILPPLNILSQGIPSTETTLKKYALAESLEVGFEFAYIMPNSNRTNNMGNAYFTLTHSPNAYSSYKFRTGILNGEYLLYNQNLGRLYFIPIMTTYISSIEAFNLENPKPYYGVGIGYYFFENFKSAQRQYAKYECENSYGYHFLIGAKYIYSPELLIRGELSYDTIRPFRFYNDALGVFGTRNVRRINFSNVSLTLNAAFLF